MSKYWVDFYEWVGEHGELSSSSSVNFAPVYKEAKSFYRREKKAKNLKDYGYIGVNGQGMKFAIIYVTEEYLKTMRPMDFKKESHYEPWMAAARECLNTGKPVKGSYSKKMAKGGNISKRFKKGDIVELSESGWDNETYHAFFDGNDSIKLKITDVYTSESQHPGFDSYVGSALYSTKRVDTDQDVPFDLYDWELEKSSSRMAKGGAVGARSGKQNMMWRGGSVSDIDSRTESTATDDLRDELREKMKSGDVVLNFAYTDYGGDFFDKVAIDYFLEYHPHNIVVEDTGWNGRNAFVFGKPAQEFLEESQNYLLGFENIEEYFSRKENEETVKGYEFFVDNTLSNYEFDRDAVLEALREKYDGYWIVNTQGLDYSEKEMIDYLKEKKLITEEEFANGGTMKGKERNNAIYKYVINAIDPSGYDIKAETDAEKIEFVWDTFLSEYGSEIKRRGMQGAFIEWISNLPSSFNIDFENHRILELGKQWGILKENATDRQEDKFLESWWNRMFVAFKTAAKKNKVPLLIRSESGVSQHMQNGGLTDSSTLKYRLENWDYQVYEDDYKNGEGAHINSYDAKVGNTFDTPEALLKECAKLMYTDFKKDNFVSFEDGRVISSVTVNDDNFPASKHEIEQWKAGKLKLYSAHYNFYVVAVNEKVPTAEEIAKAFGIQMYAKGGSIRCRECDKMEKGGSTSKYGNPLLDYLFG